MNEQMQIIRDFLNNKDIKFEGGEDSAVFWYDLSGRISMCRMELRPQINCLEIAAQLPLRVCSGEYGRVLYALMGINRTLVRGGFELTPEGDLLRFRVCIVPGQGEDCVGADRVELAVEYCCETVRKWELQILEILSSNRQYVERDGAEVFCTKNDDDEYYDMDEDDYDDMDSECMSLLDKLKEILGLR